MAEGASKRQTLMHRRIVMNSNYSDEVPDCDSAKSYTILVFYNYSKP